MSQFVPGVPVPVGHGGGLIQRDLIQPGVGLAVSKVNRVRTTRQGDGATRYFVPDQATGVIGTVEEEYPLAAVDADPEGIERSVVSSATGVEVEIAGFGSFDGESDPVGGDVSRCTAR